MTFKWDDENKAAAVEAYEAANPTPENSMEIVKELAEDFGCTPNGLRTVLSRAKVYIKKTPVASSKSGSSGASTRVSKADAINTLTEAIESIGLEPNKEIIDRLTGKAAVYFAEIINATKE